MRIIRKPEANPKSKTQLLKAKRLKERPIKFVVCERCHIKNKTLYNVGGKYYCEICKAKIHA